MPYKKNFIGGYRIPLPTITEADHNLTPPLNYRHHSIVMNMDRRFAFFAASNTDGNTWNPIDRKGGFKKDRKLESQYQLGDELYQSVTGSGGKVNDFDQGHLTSFQEVLWGEESDLKRAGTDTFYYTNCVPQHRSLNRGAWRSLEQFLIKKGADPNELKIAVMTGPVLLRDDPYFINVVNGEYIRLPCAFWKVIYYKGMQGLQAVGFMMSHRDLLLEDGTITYKKSDVSDRSTEVPADIFMMFPKATAYQVSVGFIESITKLNFYKLGVQFPYQRKDTREVIYKRIEVAVPRGVEDTSFVNAPIDYDLENISF